MGSLYKRGKIWWMAFLDSSGKRQLRSTEKRDERNARQVLEEVEALVRGGRAPSRPLTVEAWAERWAVGRPPLDLGRLRKHVLPVIGSRRLDDVSQLDVRQLVTGWRDGGELAPRTIRNVFWAMSRLFSDAIVQGLLTKTPCVLVRGDRPKIRDADRRWRQTAVFSRAEAVQLFTDPRVPADRRAMWAISLLAGLRLGEVSALRWRDLDLVRKPLGCLHISSSYTRINRVEKGTKTETPRQVPVHPALAAVLKQWREAGWAELFGRPPAEEDLVIPNRRGVHLNDQNVNESRTIDFAALSMRRRRFHDARRTFISLAQVDGAAPHVLKLVTHGAPSEVMDLYTSLPWEKLCEAVSSLQVPGSPQEPVPAAGEQLQPQLRSGPSVVQPGEPLDIPSCPRRDSNPYYLPSADPSTASPTRERGTLVGVPRRPLDGDCSNVATASRIPDLAGRLLRLAEKYRGAA